MSEARDNVNAKFMPIEKFGVGTWRDGPVGSDAPVDAVVLHFTMEVVKLALGVMEAIEGHEDIDFGIRFKSRERVDSLIRLLEEHRDLVWP